MQKVAQKTSVLAPLSVTDPDWNIDSRYLRLAAKLLFDAHRQFYECFSTRQEALINQIAAQLKEPSSDLGTSKLVVAETRLMGVAAFYPLSEMRVRQTVSLKVLLETQPLHKDVRDRLQCFREKLAPYDFSGLYLTRISVDPRFRNLGVGRSLMDCVEHKAVEQGLKSIGLHVLRSNDSAVSFYRSLGYRTTSPPETDYPLFTKSL